MSFYPSEKSKGLDSLNDATITSPKNHEVLMHNGTDWENSDVLKEYELVESDNLLPNNATSKTVNNVKVNVDADGILYTSDTANANGYFDIYPKSTNLFLEKGKTYKLIDGTEEDSSVVGVQIFFYDSSDAVISYYEKGQTFTVPNNTVFIYVALRIQNQVDFSSKVFKPMVTTNLSATGTDFVPYKKSIKDQLKEYEVTPSKNLLPSFSELAETGHNSVVMGTNIFSEQDDGAILANGTTLTDTQSEWNIQSIKPSELGLVVGETYVVTGLTNHVYDNDYEFGIYFPDSGGWVWDTTGQGITFTMNQAKYDDVFNAGVVVRKNKTVSNIKFYPMICTLAEWNKSHTYEPYHAPLKDGMLPRAEQSVLGAKNLLQVTATTSVVTGVTFTVTTDGIISTSGTSTETSPAGRSNLPLNSRIILPVGRYILTGCPSGGGSSTYDIWVNFFNSSGQQIYNTPNNHDTGNGFAFNVFRDVVYMIVYVRCVRGVDVTGKVFKPMIRLASDPSSTFSPYAMTNRELTEKTSKLQQDIPIVPFVTPALTSTTNDANNLPCGFTRLNDNNANMPTHNNVWYDVMTVRQSNDSGTVNWGYGFQLAVQTTSDSNFGDTYIRALNGGGTPSWSAWKKLN